MIRWPILTKLAVCGHFRTFTVAESPRLGERVRCFECGVDRAVVGSVDVGRLVEIVDRRD